MTSSTAFISPPETIEDKASVGQSLFEAGNLPGALPYLLEASRAYPEERSYRRRVAECLLAAGHMALAAKWATLLLREAPDDAHIAAVLATVYDRVGEPQRAFDLILPFLERGSNDVLAWTIYGRSSRRLGRGAEALTQIEATRNEWPQGPSRSTIEFVLGELFDSLGRHAEAFEAYATANTVSGAAYDPAAYEAQVDAVIDAFSADRFREGRNAPARGPQPIFIVGLPRSGTSLTEQVLDMHPDVLGLGEREAMRTLGLSFLRSDPEASWPHQVADADESKLVEMANWYFASVGGSPQYPGYVTDKMPENLLFLGAIALLFPHARAIICDRDPMDTLWSCYKLPFVQTQPWSTRFDWMAHRWEQSRRLIRHWDNVLPIAVRRWSFETFVRAPNAEIPKLLEWIGLSPCEACQRPEASTRLVNTASYAQVRRAISPSGVGRYRPYGQWLLPLSAALEATATAGT